MEARLTTAPGRVAAGAASRAVARCSRRLIRDAKTREDATNTTQHGAKAAAPGSTERG